MSKGELRKVTQPLPSLDYAFLADFAQVADGKLTAVGASFTVVAPGQYPTAMQLSIAGRIRVAADTPNTQIEIRVVPPDNAYELKFNGQLIAGDSKPYDGKIGLLFAFSTQIPLTNPGLYEFHISIDGTHVRKLAFQALD